LAAVTVGRGDQFFGLGYGDGAEKIWKDSAQRASEPHVKKVREIGVSDVVVVRRISGNEGAATKICPDGISLNHFSLRTIGDASAKSASNDFPGCRKAATNIAEWT